MRLVLLFLVLVTPPLACAVVSEHGRLQVRGNLIEGEHGRPVSLAGNSFFWSQWEGEFYNARAVRWLKEDWHSTVVRAAVGIGRDGYLSRPRRETRKVRRLVEAAIEQDLYVIIDWHDHHAEDHVDEAVRFFREMARRYGHHPHVIYEVYNEPLRVSWSDVIKPYAEQVIAAIRELDPDNLILVGTPNWSQDVEVAAADPIKDPNVAYTLHFYAGTHRQPLRDKAVAALESGVALFVSEWGTVNANGDGPVDEASTREWMNFIRQWRLSHCNWAVSDKRENASIIVPGASRYGGWPESELTESGRLVRDLIRGWTVVAPADAAPPSTPGPMAPVREAAP